MCDQEYDDEYDEDESENSDQDFAPVEGGVRAMMSQQPRLSKEVFIRLVTIPFVLLKIYDTTNYQVYHLSYSQTLEFPGLLSLSP